MSVSSNCALLIRSAVLIQRRALTWIARRWFKWVAYRRWNAALYIQSWYKAARARIYVQELRKVYRAHRRAARKIQSAYRMRLGKKRFRRVSTRAQLLTVEIVSPSSPRASGEVGDGCCEDEQLVRASVGPSTTGLFPPGLVAHVLSPHICS